MPVAKPTLAGVSARLDRLESVLDRLGPVSDPAPDDWGRYWRPGWGTWGGWRPPRPGDPSPLDLSRLSRVQLELAVHEIAAERVRLDALEGMVKEQIAALGRG
jgi:hypothetical protein